MSKLSNFFKSVFDPSYVAQPKSQPEQAADSAPAEQLADKQGKNTEPQGVSSEPRNEFLGGDNVTAYRNVTESLKIQLRTMPKDMTNSKLLLLVPDTNDYMVLDTQQFLDQASRELGLEGFHFNEICVRNESCPEGKSLKLVGGTFYWMIEKVETRPQPPKKFVKDAEIRVFEGMGKTLEDCYRLENVDGRVYRIGRGSGHGLEKNDIAFDPDPEGAFYEFNQYVRSQHAHINVIGGHFCLSPYVSGTRVDGGRTQIKRGNSDTFIDLDNTATSIELHSGDRIVLSKNAVLQVNFVDHNN